AETISRSQASDQEQNGSRIERAQRGDKTIEDLLAELELLSDDDAQALLDEKFKVASAQGMGND
ncbi:MAG: hypothetical protein L0220_07555, partial [Acidobacteria bacterium]|nr:hypothetical protein [Acidobacteriota bacterium]